MIRRICQLLGNPIRRRIMMRLDEGGPRFAAELSAELKVDLALVEYHLRVLRTAGFVDKT